MIFTYERGLCQVTKDGGHRVKRVEFALKDHNNTMCIINEETRKHNQELLHTAKRTTERFYLSLGFELNPRAELSQENQIQDDRSSKERVLTCVVEHNGVLPSHEYLRSVLVHSPLTVTNIRHMLQHQEDHKITMRKTALMVNSAYLKKAPGRPIDSGEGDVP